MRAEDQKQEYHLEGPYNECKIPGVEQYTHLNLPEYASCLLFQLGSSSGHSWGTRLPGELRGQPT